MKRSRLHSIARWAGTSICAVTSVIGVASGFRYVSLDRLGGQERASFAVAAGRVELIWGGAPVHAGAPSSWHLALYSPQSVFADWRWRWSFEFYGPPRVAARWFVALPLWAPIVLFGLPSSLLWYRWYREHRIRPGHCPTCGYDLAGNTTGRCPECGETSE